MTDRVVVIGAGVVGLCAAHALEKRGWKVTVVEARTPGYGASRVNAGRICPSDAHPVPAPGLVGQSLKWMRHSDSPLYIQPRPSPELARYLFSFWRHCDQQAFDAGSEAMVELSKNTFRLFDELKQAGVAFEEHQIGTLHVYEDRARLEEALRAHEPLADQGMNISGPILGDDLRQLEPSLTDHVVGGYWVEQDRLVRPDTLCRGLVDSLSGRGIEIRSGAEVVGFDISGDRVSNVRFAKGRLETDAVVIAAGSWSPLLAGMARRRLPMQPGKGYALDYSPSPVDIRNHLHVDSGRHAVSPFDGMTRLAGTMELSGINERIRLERVEAIVRSAAHTFRGWPTDLGVPVVGSGLRPMSADGLPIIGWLPGYRNLAVATGHGMLGLTMGPSTGEAVADLMTTNTMPETLKPFDPGRFGRI
jgi:D-amino-acid dehydrogenase